MNFLTEKIYDEALQQVNFRFDAANERNFNLFGGSWYTKHFSWNPNPRTSEEFKTVIGKNYFNIAASTINKNSGDPVRSIDGFGEIKQSMFTHAHTFKLEAEDLRNIAIYQKMFGNNPKQLMDYIVNKLYEVRMRAANGIHERMDIMILTALTNAGNYTFTENNDPNSPFVGQTINFGTPSTGSVDTEWTAANASTVDPIQDISDVCDALDVPAVKILMSKARVLYMLSNAKVRAYINGKDYSGNPVTLAMLNNFMAGIGLPTIEVVRKKSRVQKNDSFIEVEPFDGKKIVFVPAEQFGTIESTFTDKELGLASPGVAYQNVGRIELSNWKSGEKEGTNYTEYTKAKVTAAPAIDRLNDMYQLTVEN